MDRLCYRERRTFCVQATVTMVTYSLRGQVRAPPNSFLLNFHNKSLTLMQGCCLQQGLLGSVVYRAAVFVSQEDRCLFWTHQSLPVVAPSPQVSPAPPPPPPPATPSSPRSLGASPCSSSSPLDHRRR